jgi:septal ring factor EnvC (AmiA/AmiB activator)
MKRITVFIFLLVFGIGATMSAQAQRITPEENARRSSKASKKQQKNLKKANKKQQKAMKKSLKQQQKANKKANKDLQKRHSTSGVTL